MTTVQRPANHATQDIIIRGLSSITPQQATMIDQAVQASGQEWDVLPFDDYDGYLSILLQPRISIDQQAYFFISGTAQSLELSEANGDDPVTIATFTRAETLAARVLELIILRAAVADHRDCR